MVSKQHRLPGIRGPACKLMAMARKLGVAPGGVAPQVSRPRIRAARLGHTRPGTLDLSTTCCCLLLQAESLADCVVALEEAVQQLQGLASTDQLRAAAQELLAAVRAQAPAFAVMAQQGGVQSGVERVISFW
jgi:hypothetical protein